MIYLPRINSIFWIFFTFSLPSACQDHTDRSSTVDVLHYRFEIDLNDSTDVLAGQAEVDILFREETREFYLDLIGLSGHGTGMVIDRIESGGRNCQYVHADDKILFSLNGISAGDTCKFLIQYHGIPADGLIISENCFGDRTFFGDNWPDRARYWLPMVDHPSDKATVEFLVEAPGHYSIVSVGELKQEYRVNERVFSLWECTVPLPTKLMVIGVSPFEVQRMTSGSGIPVSTWVYPQNKEAGFSDYSVAVGPLDFFESYIAPYPYVKLANVQSRTRFGGMENASCIFYHERTVTGKGGNEKLFAHEIAHQWFGDAVTEGDWHHVWLSEGFATYLADMYLEHAYGRNTFISSLLEEREEVLKYSRRRMAPVVDTTLPVSVWLLNPNSYEKAAWVLHMLRRQLGDELFRRCIRAFFQKFKFGNAVTPDFRIVVDSVSGGNFEPFFQQWIFTAGHPVLSADWHFENGVIKIRIRQHQEQSLFSFPLDIRVNFEKGTGIEKTLQVSLSDEVFSIPSVLKPCSVELDPDHWLLFENY